jgi:hypothetical protein
MNDWFGVDGLIPHGFCLSWDPSLMAAVVIANAAIALAYTIIAAALVTAAIAPRPVVPRWLYWSFAGFIFCCGVSHVLDDVTLWFPIYRVQAAVLSITAIVSLLTAVLPLSFWLTREATRWRS